MDSKKFFPVSKAGQSNGLGVRSPQISLFDLASQFAQTGPGMPLFSTHPHSACCQTCSQKLLLRFVMLSEIIQARCQP